MEEGGGWCLQMRVPFGGQQKGVFASDWQMLMAVRFRARGEFGMQSTVIC